MFDKLKEIIEEKLNAEGTQITEATSFKDDLDADSLDLFELVMALEDEFEVEILAEAVSVDDGFDAHIPAGGRV